VCACVCRSDVESFSDVCLHVSEVIADKKLDSSHLLLLPEYSCLQLSPARFWNHDRQRYLYVSWLTLQLSIFRLNGFIIW